MLNMLNEKFSNTKNYAIERFPTGVNFFNKKKWLQGRLASFDNKKILAFTDKTKFMWVFLQENEEFWLPFEKAMFFMEQFDNCKGNVLIIEQQMKQNDENFCDENQFFYYALVDKFLVAYTDNYDEALSAFMQYGDGKPHVNFGIGNEVAENFVCQKNLNQQMLVNKIGFGQTVPITDDLLYLNDEHCQVEEKNNDDLFFYWFNNKKASKPRFRKLHIFLFVSLVFFFVTGLCCSYMNRCLDIEIAAVMKRINELQAKDKKEQQ